MNYCVDFSFCFNYLIMTQGLFSHRTEPKLDLSHKLLPRSPTMDFSSVRENVTPTLRIVLQNVSAHCISLFNFEFCLIVTTDVIVVCCIGSLME